MTSKISECQKFNIYAFYFEFSMHIMPEDRPNDGNMQQVLMGLTTFVMFDGYMFTIFSVSHRYTYNGHIPSHTKRARPTVRVNTHILCLQQGADI